MDQSQAPILEVDKSAGLHKPKFGYQPESSNLEAEVFYGKIFRPNIPKRHGFCEDLRKNKPQSKSLRAATMIFVSGGMSLSSSIAFGTSNAYGTHLQSSWFIGVIVGACLSTSIAHKLSKRIFNVISSILVIMTGLFLILATQIAALDMELELVSRYCDGIAVGFTLIPTILAGSEQSVQKLRGYVLSAEHLGLVSGSMLNILCTNFLESGMQSKAVHGALTIVWGALALFFTFVYTIESPVFLLRKQNEEEAIESLRKLQCPNAETNEICALLNENKAFLNEDLSRGIVQNISNSWLPMIKIVVFRSFVTMSFSFPLTLSFASASSRNDNWIFVYRLIGVIFSICFMDNIGRKIPSALSLFFGGIVIFAFGGLVPNSLLNFEQFIPPAMFLFPIYQIVSGIMAPSSTCYLGEAFSLSVKPYFILVIVMVENIIQIAFCHWTSIEIISNFAWVLGGVQVLYAIIFFLTMPETMQMTLREALAMFRETIVVYDERKNEEEEVEKVEVQI